MKFALPSLALLLSSAAAAEITFWNVPGSVFKPPPLLEAVVIGTIDSPDLTGACKRIARALGYHSDAITVDGVNNCRFYRQNDCGGVVSKVTPGEYTILRDLLRNHVGSYRCYAALL